MKAKLLAALAAFITIYRWRNAQRRAVLNLTLTPLPKPENQLTTTNGLTLEKFWFRCPPGTKAKACLVYIHGYALHGLFFEFHKIAAVFTANDIDVLSITLRGYGSSQGLRGYAESIDEYLDDVEAAVFEAKRNVAAGTPLFLFGYSMGGLSSVCLLSRRPHVTKEITALLLQGAWQSSELYHDKHGFITLPHFLIYIIRLLAWINPEITLMGDPNEMWKFAHRLSSDKGTQDAFMSDPEIYRGGAKLAWLVAMTKECDQIDNDWKNIHLPVLAMHGTKDCITNHASSVRMIKAIPSQVKELKLYEDMRHQLLNEAESVHGGGPRVVKDIIEWINKILALASATGARTGSKSNL